MHLAWKKTYPFYYFQFLCSQLSYQGVKTLFIYIITSKVSALLTSFKFYLNNIYRGRIQPFDHISHHTTKVPPMGWKDYTLDQLYPTRMLPVINHHKLDNWKERKKEKKIINLHDTSKWLCVNIKEHRENQKELGIKKNHHLFA